VALLGVVLLVPCLLAQEKAEEALAQSLKEADVIFIGTIGKVEPLSQTNSIPPSTSGRVSFKVGQTLHGTVPEGATFTYTYKEGTTKNMELGTDAQVLVAAKGKGVFVIVPATEANMALVKKVLAPPK